MVFQIRRKFGKDYGNKGPCLSGDTGSCLVKDEGSLGTSRSRTMYPEGASDNEETEEPSRTDAPKRNTKRVVYPVPPTTVT